MEPREVTPPTRPQPHQARHPIPSTVEAAQQDESVLSAAPVAGRRRAVIVGALAVVAIWVVMTAWSSNRTQRPANEPSTVNPPREYVETEAAETAPLPPLASAVPDVVEQEMCSDGARVRLELTNIGGVTGLFSSIKVRFELHRSPVGHEWRILVERFSGMGPPIVVMRLTRVASDSGDLVVQRSRFREGMLRVWFRAKALDRQTGQVCTVSATAARRE